MSPSARNCRTASIWHWENADEKREFQNIARQKLGRCRMLVVCGKEISNSMSAEIGMAEKRNLICTTLDGLAKIKEAEE